MKHTPYVNKGTSTIPPFLFSSIPNKYTSDIYLNFILLKCKEIESDVIEFKSGRKAMLRRIRKKCATLGIANLYRGIYKVRVRPKELKMAYIFEFVKR
jgi:hypothetical protein